ncbi:hypothetical protein JCM24511_05501 [Saitozyma sp. JCM 24511]|nr:hypothetical protein JCM24511_05501 [Saitozyma sp. JCM 24511]
MPCHWNDRTRQISARVGLDQFAGAASRPKEVARAASVIVSLVCAVTIRGTDVLVTTVPKEVADRRAMR